VHSSADADALRSSPIRGRAQLGRQACLKQGARLIPDCLRYSVSADGSGVDVLGVGFEFHVPSGAAEHHSEDRVKLAPCLSESSIARPRVAQAPVFTRSAGNPRQRASLRVRLSFGPFLWRRKEKYMNSWANKRKYLAIKAKPGIEKCDKETFAYYRGKSEQPIKNSSTARAHCRPSRIAQTTSDCPRRISPAVNTLSMEV